MKNFLKTIKSTFKKIVSKSETNDCFNRAASIIPKDEKYNYSITLYVHGTLQNIDDFVRDAKFQKLYQKRNIEASNCTITLIDSNRTGDNTISID